MKKLFAVLLVLLAAAAVFAGGDGESGDEGGKTTIKYYMWDDPTYMQIVEAYNNSQDAVFVDMQIVPAADYEIKLLTILAGGVEVDAYMQKNQNAVFQQISNGYVEPLNTYIEQTGYDVAGLGSFGEGVTFDGEVMALPFRGGTWFTYFNKNIFDAAGMEYPTAYVERGEWDWETFVEVSSALSTHDGKQYGALLYTWPMCSIIPASQEGIPFITTDGRVDISGDIMKSFEIRKQLESDLSIYPLLELKTTKTHYSTAFFEGTLGMVLIGEWFPGQLLNARTNDLFENGFSWDDWGVARLPNDGDTYTTVGSITSNLVHADSKKKEAAFDFIAWMAGPEGAVEVAKAGFMPARNTEAVTEALSSILPNEDALAAYIEPVDISLGFYNKYGASIESVVDRLVEAYLIDEITTEQKLRSELQKRL